MNLLLDTCVVIDYLGRQKPFYEAAEKVVAAGYFGDAKLWVAGQSLNDAFYVLKKYRSSKDVQSSIGALLELITAVSLVSQDYIQATRLQWDDMEDCLVAICAEKAKADYLITRDIDGFARSSVPAVTPEQWLEIMEAEYGLAYGTEQL